MPKTAKKGTKKGVIRGKKQPEKTFHLTGKTVFLTYRGVTDLAAQITRQELANFLIWENPNERTVRPQKYLVCRQVYTEGQHAGEPHFHVILAYAIRKNIQNPNHYDYLGIHPNIQAMRNMKAALQYVHKQDSSPLTNMDLAQQKRVARARDSSSLYPLFQDQMRKDPFDFDVDDYCRRHDIFRQIYKANYSKAITLLRRAQQAQCRAILRDMPGIRQITRRLIQQVFTAAQLTQYDSWDGYARIIRHINQVVRYPNKGQATRLPDKTRHLFLCGPSDIGKSALVTHRATSEYPYPGLSYYFSTYYLNAAQRFFPPYTTYMSSIVRWNQFVIGSSIFPKSRYNQLLDYLEGAPTQIPIKGRLPVRRMDNPKHILTSNRALAQHILKTFNSRQSRTMARMNLRARLDQIVVPPGRSLHFLRRLFYRIEI